METVDTVTINTPNGPVRINATDYKPGEHTLAEGSAPAPAPVNAGSTTPPAGGPATAPGAPVQKFVEQIGNRFFVTDGKGNALDPDHVGFPSQEEAVAAAQVPDAA